MSTMSIQALPEPTTRRQGTGQALATLAALVKELLENAIDARATSIEVPLSANVLDKIEVRANGSELLPITRSKLAREATLVSLPASKSSGP